MERLKYYIYRGLYFVLSHLPWWFIETLAYIGALFLYSVLAYRRELVERNIRNSFPQKSEAELRLLVWDFYHHLTMQLLSPPKILNAPAETIKNKHLQFFGLEQLEADLEQGTKAIILLMGHCGNWEVFTAANLYLKPLGLQVEQLYRPLKNKALDRVQLELRQRFGAVTTPKSDIGRSLIKQLKNKDEEVHVIAFIADQTPSYAHIGLWTKFLNQETPWLNGAERLAQKYALPVYYLDIVRISNRQYEGRLISICKNGATSEQNVITEKFSQLLEATIKRDPAIWLWSHNRWKHRKSY